MENRYHLFIQTPHPKDVNDYWHIFNTPNILNAVYWNNFFQLVHGLDGDIVECGVGRGRSLLTLLSLESYYRTFSSYAPRTILALDSFEGFPEPAPEDSSPRNPKKGEWSSSPNNDFKYSSEALKKIISNAGIPDSTTRDLQIIKGFFKDSLPKVSSEKIAILHLDSDLYHSVKDPLLALADKMVPGGIIVIDDYLLADDNQASEPFPGARLAIEEFLESHNDFCLNESVRGTPYLTKKNK